MEETITFEYLYDVLRKEKYSKELQKLNDNFLSNLKKYVTEKTSILKSQAEKDSIFTAAETQKTRKQLENVERLIKELFERRENKVLHLAFLASKTHGKHALTSNLLKEEELLFNSIVESLGAFRQLAASDIIPHEKIQKHIEPKDIKTEDKSETKAIKVLQQVPQFVGTDMQVYGPFNQTETAVLPLEIADLLVEKKIAETIEK